MLASIALWLYGGDSWTDVADLKIRIEAREDAGRIIYTAKARQWRLLATGPCLCRTSGDVIVNRHESQAFVVRPRLSTSDVVENHLHRTIRGLCRRRRCASHGWITINQSINQSKPVTPRRRWGTSDRCLCGDGRQSTPGFCNAEQL